MNAHVLKMLYFAFVYPHLLYGIEIYGNEQTGRHKVTRVKSIYLVNAVVKQENLTKTQKTEQATHCSVTGNRVPFITRYCKLILIYLG